MKILEQNLIYGEIQKFKYIEREVRGQLFNGGLVFEDSYTYDSLKLLIANKEYSAFEWIIIIDYWRQTQITSETVPYSVSFTYLNKKSNRTEKINILLNNSNSFFYSAHIYIWGDVLVDKLCTEASPSEISVQFIYYKDGRGAVCNKKDVYEDYDV